MFEMVFAPGVRVYFAAKVLLRKAWNVQWEYSEL